MSSQDDYDNSSIVSSSHDRSDDDWNGVEDDDLTRKKKKSTAAAATSGRRQLARRPSKPRSTIGFGSYKYSSDSSNSSDDEGDVNNAVNQSMKSEEDEISDNESASSDSPPIKIQRKNNKQNTKRINQSTAKSNKSTVTKSKKKGDSESEEAVWDDDEEKSESNESESSDSDFGAPPPSSRKRRGKAGAKKSTTKNKPSRAAARTKTPRSTRATRKVYKDENDQSSSEDEIIQYDTTPSGTRRPRRSCSQQTKQRMSNVVKQDMKSEREALGGVLEDDDKELLENSSSGDEGTKNNNNDGDDDDANDRRLQKQVRQTNVKKRSVRRKRKLGDESTDEDYDENNSESDQDDDFIENDDDDEDYEIGSDDMAVSKRRITRKQTRGSKKKPSYTEIEEDDIGTADESTSDEETAPSILTSPAKKSPGTYGTPASRKKARMEMNGRIPLQLREDGSSNEEQGEDSDEYIPSSRNRKSTKARKRRHYMDSSDSDNSNVQKGSSPITKLRTTCIKCSSVIDDITMMNLPKNKPHVCYIAPDGKSRHCFTLDTLYRIAISAKSDNDSTSSSPLKFLQPPHFRSLMEGGLIDQIASRFGRPALVIENSSVYKKIKGGRLGSSNLDELDEFDEDGNYVGDDREVDGANFQDRFQRFITTLMGSSDIYCCPLCYIEADRRLGHQNDDEMIEDDESEDGQVNDSHEDRFAFVDDPLTILGNLDDDIFEVASTFCFRLLSGLKKHLKVVHGVNLSDIEGNDLFKRFQVRASDGLLQRWLQKNLRRNTVQGDMMRYWNSGENQSFLLLLSQIDSTEPEYSSDFSLSFPNRARKIWNQVASPYMKHGQDMDDFIADDDESEESGNNVPINPHFTPPSTLQSEPDFKSPEEEIIENLQKKNRYKSTSNDSKDESSSSDDEELEILEPAPSEESEEDEWTKSKSFQTRVKQKSKSSTQESDTENEFDAEVEIIDEKSKVKSPPTSARKRIMESSSDEESY